MARGERGGVTGPTRRSPGKPALSISPATIEVNLQVFSASLYSCLMSGDRRPADNGAQEVGSDVIGVG